MDHLQQLSDKIDATQRDVAEMKDFLLGSQFNEKKGIASIIEDHDKRITLLEEHRALTKVYSDLVKWFFTFMMTGIVGLLVYLIQQHHK